MLARLSRRTPQRQRLRRAVAPSRAAPAGPLPPPGPRHRSSQAPITSHDEAIQTRARPIQARNNSGQYPLLPAGRQAAAEHGWPVTALLPNTLPSTPGKSRNDIRILSVTLGGAMGIRTPDLLHAMERRSVHHRPPPFTMGTADQPVRPPQSAGVHHRSLRTVTSLVTSHPRATVPARKARRHTSLLPGQAAHAPRLRQRALPACPSLP